MIAPEDTIDRDKMKQVSSFLKTSFIPYQEKLPEDLKIYVASERTPLYQGDQPIDKTESQAISDEELLRSTKDNIDRLARLIQT
jgi:hypothetical protein